MPAYDTLLPGHSLSPVESAPADSTGPVAEPAPSAEAELQAAYEEFIHQRNSLGDGCPACGSSQWGKIHNTNNRPFHLKLLSNILDAVKGLKG